MQSFSVMDYLNIESANSFVLNMDIEELIGRIKEGDNVALETLYETYAPMMRNVCVNITNEDEDIVNDLVQMAFIRAYYSLFQLRDTSKFGEWVATITKNVALKHLAQKRKMPFVPFSSTMEEELEIGCILSSDSLLAEKEIHELIDQLPKGYGRVFRMSVIEGYSHQEIAEKLGIEPHSSSSQLSRAKALLRKMINRRGMGIVIFVLVCTPLGIYLLKDRGKEEIQKNNIASEKKNIIRQVENKAPNNAVNVASANSVAEIRCNQYGVSSIIPEEFPSNDSIYTLKDSIQHKSVAVENNDSILPDTCKQPCIETEHYLADNEQTSKKHQWQLLAAGSLGSALAQNAYKLFVGNASGDTDGPQPSGPGTFSTWEGYYHYLQQNAHDDMSKKDKALMDIAQNNKGKIEEHEHHDKPVTFGLSVTKSLGNNWNLETGLQYSLLKSDFTLGEGAYYINRNQKVHYLGIPLQVSYKWLDVKNWSVYSSLGGALHIPIYGKTSERYIVGNTTPYMNNWHFTPSRQWSIGTSIGVQYKFAPKWGVYIEPSFNWYVPNGSSIHTIWTEHPFSFTIPFGVRFTW